MRPPLALIGCLVLLAGPLAAAPSDPPPAGPTGNAPAGDVASLRRQVAAQAAEIERLQGQVAAQAAEIERLKRPSAAPAPPAAPPATSAAPVGLPKASVAVYDFILAGSYPAAVGAADNALARDPGDLEVTALKAYALAAFGSTDGARPLLVKALKGTAGKTGRTRALTLVAQGVVAASDGDTRAAASAFQSAGNADPSLALAYLAYADLLHKVGKDEMAHTLLRAATQEKMTATEAAAIKQKLAGP